MKLIAWMALLPLSLLAQPVVTTNHVPLGNGKTRRTVSITEILPATGGGVTVAPPFPGDGTPMIPRPKPLHSKNALVLVGSNFKSLPAAAVPSRRINQKIYSFAHRPLPKGLAFIPASANGPHLDFAYNRESNVLSLIFDTDGVHMYELRAATDPLFYGEQVLARFDPAFWPASHFALGFQPDGTTFYRLAVLDP